MKWKSSGEPVRWGFETRPAEHCGERGTVQGSSVVNMSTKLFVGNLDFKVTENDLQDAFAAHGTVVEANLVTDRTTGRPRGFGFVTMSSPEEAQKAIDALNGKQL